MKKCKGCGCSFSPGDNPDYCMSCRIKRQERKRRKKAWWGYLRYHCRGISKKQMGEHYIFERYTDIPSHLSTKDIEFESVSSIAGLVFGNLELMTYSDEGAYYVTPAIITLKKDRYECTAYMIDGYYLVADQDIMKIRSVMGHRLYTRCASVVM